MGLETNIFRHVGIEIHKEIHIKTKLEQRTQTKYHREQQIETKIQAGILNSNQTKMKP